MTPPPIESVNRHGLSTSILQQCWESAQRHVLENKEKYKASLKQDLYAHGHLPESTKIDSYRSQYECPKNSYETLEHEVLKQFEKDKNQYKEAYGQALQEEGSPIKEHKEELAILAQKLGFGDAAVDVIRKEYRDRPQIISSQVDPSPVLSQEPTDKDFQAYRELFADVVMTQGGLTDGDRATLEAMRESLNLTVEQAQELEQDVLSYVESQAAKLPTLEPVNPSTPDKQQPAVPAHQQLPVFSSPNSVSTTEDNSPAPSQSALRTVTNWSIWLGGSALGLAGTIAVLAFVVRPNQSDTAFTPLLGLQDIHQKTEALLAYQKGRALLLSSLLQGRGSMMSKVYAQMFLDAEKSYQEGNLDEGCALAAKIPTWSSNRSDAQNIVARCNVEREMLTALSNAYNSSDWNEVITHAQNLRDRDVPYVDSPNVLDSFSIAAAEREARGQIADAFSSVPLNSTGSLSNPSQTPAGPQPSPTPSGSHGNPPDSGSTNNNTVPVGVSVYNNNTPR
jgi:hypothetical protein